MASGLKFWIKKVEGLYYLCSENKGADQLRVYREADLRLCFRICKMPVLLRDGSYVNSKGDNSLGLNSTIAIRCLDSIKPSLATSKISVL